MARSRNIKPGFYKNEDLAECSVWARLIYPGLWMLADREGRLEDRPKRIKGELLPFDAVDVEPLLRELDARKFILRYEVDGVRYIQILKFADHQTPHYTEKPSVLPPPPLQEFARMKAPTLQETEGDISGENSRSRPGIKRGSKPPDSLNHDSLNHESRKQQGAFALPDWVPRESWDAWLQVRKRKKAPDTERALVLAVAEMDKLRRQGEDPGAILDQSTTRGWTGLFTTRGRGAAGAAAPVRDIREAAARSIGLGEPTTPDDGAIDGTAQRVG